jgi:hypothetical protein
MTTGPRVRRDDAAFSLHPTRMRNTVASPKFHARLEAPMLPALIPHTQTAARRVVIYASCISSIFFAAVLLSIHGKLRDPSNSLPESGIVGFTTQVHPPPCLGLLYLPWPPQAQANAIAVDSSGNAHVAGWSTTGFPAVNPVQSSPKGVSAAPQRGHSRRDLHRGCHCDRAHCPQPQSHDSTRAHGELIRGVGLARISSHAREF